MKSILIIGMGRFGRHLCQKFMHLGDEVMIVDNNERIINELADSVTSARIADCTDEHTLKALGVANFDLCFVCMGENLESSLLSTALLKDMGARRVIAKADRDIHARLLLRNGADEVVYPERETAERMAVRMSAEHVFNYIELTDEYSMYEIPPLPAWTGHSVRELDIRNKHHINILAVKLGDNLRPMPGPDYVFTGEEHILALTSNANAKKLLRMI